MLFENFIRQEHANEFDALKIYPSFKTFYVCCYFFFKILSAYFTHVYDMLLVFYEKQIIFTILFSFIIKVPIQLFLYFFFCLEICLRQNLIK